MKSKKLPVVLTMVVFLLVLTSCQAVRTTGTQSLLEYPDTHWNDTPEAVVEALDIQESQILQNEAVESDAGASAEEWVLVASGLDCLGTASLQTQFRFINYGGASGHYGLAYVRVIFPEETDMAAIQNALTERYGTQTTQTLHTYTLVDGAVVDRSEWDLGELSRTDGEEQITASYAPEDNLYWVSGVSATEQFSKTAQDEAIDFFTQTDEANTAQAVRQWLEQEPIAYIRWSDNANQLFRDSSEYLTANEVSFSGRQFLMLQQLFG